MFSLCEFLLTVFVLCVLLSSYVYLFILFVFVYLICICFTLYVFVVPYVYLLYYVCIAVLTLDASSQYREGPAIGHLDTGSSWFPSVYERMLRWFSSFQVATTCFSCSPSDLNFLVTSFSHLFTCKITTAGKPVPGVEAGTGGLTMLSQYMFVLREGSYN